MGERRCKELLLDFDLHDGFSALGWTTDLSSDTEGRCFSDFFNMSIPFLLNKAHFPICIRVRHMNDFAQFEYPVDVRICDSSRRIEKLIVCS